MGIVDKSKVDYSVYLVTNNELIPEGLNIYDQVEDAIKNGVTLVQLREKDLDTGDFIKRAEKLHEITKKYNVPLIINDRVDVMLAVDAEGIHVGQDDMNPVMVRKLIGNDKILGVSTRCEEELMGVINSEALIDYVGMGTTYSTSTKIVKRAPLGPEGVRNLLKIIATKKPDLKSCIIGGLNKYNIAWTLSNCSYNGFNTNGVAVVSCIMGQQNAALEAKETTKSVNLGYGKLAKDTEEKYSNRKSLNVNSVTHFITNSVVKGFSANVCIASGGSPIMSENEQEFKSLAKIPNSSLCLNTGTANNTSPSMYKAAIKAYNSLMVPIVYDPVGCAATPARRELMQDLLSGGHFTVIKGNLAEICAVAGVANSNMRGVDSTMELDVDKTIKMLRDLAKSTRSIIVITGPTDIIVDGITPNETPRACTIKGGHKLMGKITGSGCSLGGVIARFIATVSYFDAYEATIAAVSFYKEAGYRAGISSAGPGTFTSKFLDELYNLSSNGDNFVNTDVTHF